MISPEFDEALLGFDIREMWPTGFRAISRAGAPAVEFMLRTDLDDVLSADTMIWPSIFKTTVTCELGPEVPRPEWVGPNAPFWGDLSALGKANPYGDSDQIHPSWIIAATWHSDLGFPKEEKQKGEFLGPHLAPTAP